MQEKWSSNEIHKIYREKIILLSVEDAMTNKLNKKQYKIVLKLVPLDEENKAKREEILTHWIDVDVAKVLFDFIYHNRLSELYNFEEVIQNKKIRMFKDMKGSLVNNDEFQSRILSVFEHDGGIVMQFTTHVGAKTDKGAIMPKSKPLQKLYIKLSKTEAYVLAKAVLNYIQQKELTQFKEYHLRTVQREPESADFNWGTPAGVF